MSEPNVDPLLAEKFYSRIEGGVAPLLRNLTEERRPPEGDEIDSLCVFMAIQWSRVPAFRPKMLEIARKVNRDNVTKALKSPASWKRVLNKLRIPVGDDGTDYEKMKKFVESEQYELSAETEWFIQQGAESSETIIPSLVERHWMTYISRNGSFIASDNPVVLEAEAKKMVGFANADVVVYPVNKYLLLLGTRTEMSLAPLTEMLIARLNTLTMLKAHEQIFSWKPDFCWLDHKERYQTDWKLFSNGGFGNP